jgi:intein/homing endonuclease
VVALHTDDGQVLIGTPNHPVYANDRWKPLGELTDWDFVTSMFDEVGVRIVNKLPYRSPVYNLTVKDASEYFANGILVHNCDAAAYAFAALDKRIAPPIGLTLTSV